MLDTKNLSPQQLSLYTATILSVPIAAGYYMMHPVWWIALVVFAIVFAGSFFLIQFTLERFIYRKIKLIYKFIYQTKATKREEIYYKYLLPQKGIDEVRADVEKWAIQQKTEIETLRSNEAYRKEFLQNLSHEFKTPIFAIQGYIHTLLDGAMEDEKLSRRFLENASRNIERMVALVKDLDEITRLESGEQKLNKTPFVIQELIKETYESLSIDTNAKNIKSTIKKGCDQPVVVVADKEKVKQVIINIVSNSTKYGKENGHIVASIYKTDGKHVLIEISDDGIGIAEEHLPRIFERFYRTDQGRSRDVGGSGIGLAICKHIIEAHGQTIHARSKPDIGTTVGFTLQAG